jgi:hypothetical protein
MTESILYFLFSGEFERKMLFISGGEIIPVLKTNQKKDSPDDSLLHQPRKWEESLLMIIIGSSVILNLITTNYLQHRKQNQRA